MGTTTVIDYDNKQRILEFLSAEELEIPGVAPVDTSAPAEVDFDICPPPAKFEVPSVNEVALLEFLGKP
jgi:hypothetical protein